MKPLVYEQFDKDFSDVTAYAVFKDGEHVGRVVFKTKKSGRVYCYAHWFGQRMTRGFAGGGGYDKQSAAAEAALAGQGIEIQGDRGEGWGDQLRELGFLVATVI